MEKNYYKILGVAEDATIDEIKKVYREQVKKHHPDINQSLSNEEIMKEINLAFEQIMKMKNSQFQKNESCSFCSDSTLKYKTSGIDFNIDSLDYDCIFVGDVYVVKYKNGYDYFDPFEDQIELKLIMKDAILLRIGFERYINLSGIKTSFVLKKIKKKLKSDSSLERDSVIIFGDFFRPYVGDKVVLNVRLYNELKTNQELTVKKIKKLIK